MDIEYCYKSCPIGSKAAEEFLDKNNSAFGAAIDFNLFVNKCAISCPYKEEHTSDTQE